MNNPIFIYALFPIVCIVCYFIGVLIGRESIRRTYNLHLNDVLYTDADCYELDPDDIQHVNYTPEQMGSDK